MSWKISVNQVVFDKSTSLSNDLEVLSAAGVRAMGVHRDKLSQAGWEKGLAAVGGSGIEAAFLIHRDMYDLEDEASWSRSSEELVRTVDASVALGAKAVYGTTGSAGAFTFEEAEDRFVAAVAPVATHARRCGVSLMLETTNPLFAHIHFLHTLRDTVAVAERAGLGVCIDLYACWTESGLRESLAKAVRMSSIVQISDIVAGAETMDRAVPGTGMIPWERLLGWVYEDGFDGWWDLELRGLQGDVDAIRRSLTAVEELLDGVGSRATGRTTNAG